MSIIRINDFTYQINNIFEITDLKSITNFSTATKSWIYAICKDHLILLYLYVEDNKSSYELDNIYIYSRRSNRQRIFLYIIRYT